LRSRKTSSLATARFGRFVPEGNGKSTFVAQIALYGADYAESPWIPIGAIGYAKQQDPLAGRPFSVIPDGTRRVDTHRLRDAHRDAEFEQMLEQEAGRRPEWRPRSFPDLEETSATRSSG
jgi:hypothetical protein